MFKQAHVLFTILMAFLLGISTATNGQTYNYVTDSTFNFTGIKRYTYYNVMDRLFDCKLQPDGRIITVGISKSPVSGAMELPVTRHLADGGFDSTFSGDGTVYINMGNVQSLMGIYPRIAFDNDGKIIIASSRMGAGSMDIFVCRIDTTGNLDPTFNGTGTMVFDVNGNNTEYDLAANLDVDANNNIWIAATTRNGVSSADNDFVVAKIKPDGTLDATFNGNGRKTFTPNTNENYCRSIKVDANGKIVVGGTSGINMYIFRIDTTGALDPTFNTSGSATIQFSNSSDLIAMDFDNNGKIVISGRYAVLGVSLVFARLNPNGQADNTFGFAGKFTINIGNTSTTITGMYIQPDNKIIVGGYTDDSTYANDFIAVRITAAGAIDLTFNGIGYVSKNIVSGPIDEYAYGLAVTPDERLILSGVVTYTSLSNEDAALLKLKPVLVVGLNTLTNPENTMRVYPNPFTNKLDIVSQVDDQMWITDITGKTVHTMQVVTGINHTDLQHLARGIYFLHGNNTSGLKLIKE